MQTQEACWAEGNSVLQTHSVPHCYPTFPWPLAGCTNFMCWSPLCSGRDNIPGICLFPRTEQWRHSLYSHSPTPGFEECLCEACLRHGASGARSPGRMPEAFAYGDSPLDSIHRREALFRAHCGFDASEDVILWKGAKGDCTQGAVFLQVTSAQWLWRHRAAQELQGRSWAPSPTQGFSLLIVKPWV